MVGCEREHLEPPDEHVGLQGLALVLRTQREGGLTSWARDGEGNTDGRERGREKSCAMLTPYHALNAELGVKTPPVECQRTRLGAGVSN